MERLCAALLQRLEVMCTTTDSIVLIIVLPPQPLQEELVATSERVVEASKEVQELREALALAQEKLKQDETGLEKAVGVAPSSVSTVILVNVDHDLITTSCDEESLTVPTSLDILSGSVNMLVPERLCSQHENTHKLQDPAQQSQSQELF